MSGYFELNRPQVRHPLHPDHHATFNYNSPPDLKSQGSPWTPLSADTLLGDNTPTPTASKFLNFRKKKTWKLRNLTSRFWLWESSACLLSLVLLGLICHNLLSIHNKPTHHWTWPWNVTSVLALAVTIMKAAMIVPVASALGQLKWHWFRKYQGLKGMELFDEASRGPLGSIRLLFALRFWYLASIGAFITLAALSIDTLVQNAVQLHFRNDTTEYSYIYRTNSFSFSSSFDRGLGKELPPSDMLSDVSYAMNTAYNLSSEGSFQRDIVSCYTGNCTFPRFQSLGVDYQCIESVVNQENEAFVHSANLTFFLDSTTGVINSTTLSQYPESGQFQNLGPLITRWLVLVNPSTLLASPIGMECAFYWAVHTYETETRDNSVIENVIDRWTNVSDRDTRPHLITLTPPICWVNGGKANNAQTECHNEIYSGSHRSLQNYFRLSDFGLIGEAINITNPRDDIETWSYSSILMQSLLASVTNANASQIRSSIDLRAYNMAFMITNYMRKQPMWFNETHSEYGKQYGTTYWAPDPYYHILWGYMVIPILLVVLSTFFFLATALSTTHEQKWKTSELATVFHGIWAQDAIKFGNVNNYADMLEVSKLVEVKLTETDVGKRLVSRGTEGSFY